MIRILGRIRALMTADERQASIRMVISILFRTLLDFMSLAVLMPVLYYLLEGMENNRAAMLFCALAVSVILLKCVISTWLIRFQNRFLLGLYRRLSITLFSSYYTRGLLFIREKGSNRLDYEVNAYCYGFSQSLLAPMAVVLGDGLLLVMATVALLIYAPLTAGILAVAFLPFMLVYTFIIRKKVKLYGEMETKAKREQYRLVSETFQGYSELMVSNAFPLFSSSFEEGIDRISGYRLKMITLQRLPMLLSELSVLTGLVLLVIFGTGDIRILLGIFALAAFRLLPAMRSILSGWTQIQNSVFILDTIEEGIAGYRPEAFSSQEIHFRKDIRIDRVSYTYPDGEKVLDDFSLSIRKGERIGFCGYSGAGKSTLFNLLLGFLKPDQGEIRIDGQELLAENRMAWLEKLGYVSQEVFLFAGTIAENISIGSPVPDKERIGRILKAVRLQEWVDSLPEGMETHLGERGSRLSGGQRQRIGIARALYRNTEVLLLDEATSSLDDQTEQGIMETLDHLKKNYPDMTILSIAHRRSSLAGCDRIININGNGDKNEI